MLSVLKSRIARPSAANSCEEWAISLVVWSLAWVEESEIAKRTEPTPVNSSQPVRSCTHIEPVSSPIRTQRRRSDAAFYEHRNGSREPEFKCAVRSEREPLPEQVRAQTPDRLNLLRRQLPRRVRPEFLGVNRFSDARSVSNRPTILSTSTASGGIGPRAPLPVVSSMSHPAATRPKKPLR